MILRDGTIISNLSKKFIDHTNKSFGLLTVLSYSHKYRRKHYWNCLCKCGIISKVETSSFVIGKTKSCGCLKKKGKEKLTTHAKSHLSEYHIWQSIKARCLNKTNHAFHQYGGRGITICQEWKMSFLNFYNDMGPRPSPDHSIDRINNMKGYTRSNCRWADQRQQCRNKRTNLVITHDKRTLCAKEWAELLNIPYKRLWRRLRHGWTFEDAISEETFVNGNQRRFRNNITTSN